MNLTSFVLSGLPLLIQYYADEYNKVDLSNTLKELEPDLGLPRINTYDFIIDNGTAGSLLASRLSEEYSVLLLEGGGPPPPQTQILIPEFYYNHPAINYEFTSTPQKKFALDDKGVLKSWSGKMGGGSFSHNANVYNRGSPRDYDLWGNLSGDPSWSYSSILKHFKAIENYKVGLGLDGAALHNETEREKYFGSEGHLPVQTSLPTFYNDWFKAGKEFGFEIADPNGHQRPSFASMAQTVKNGQRASTYTEFIKGIESSRKTLTFLKYSQVDKVLIENEAAYGVIYRRHGIPQIARASREVILSAGAFASPSILLKSGIGPRGILEKAKIPVVQELPGVGQNLWDHLGIDLPFYSSNMSLSSPSDMEIQENLVNFHSSNPALSSYGQLRGMQAFMASSRAKQEGNQDWADIQFFLWDKSPPWTIVPSSLALAVQLSRPRSVGHLVFNTSAYLAGDTDITHLVHPDFNHFADSTDMDVLIEGIQFGMKVMTESEAFRGYNLILNETEIPEECRKLGKFSRAYWECFVTRKGKTHHHFSGTCKMGQENDAMSVVDSKLRVRGICGLRVVDASVMPIVTNSNTNSPTMGISRKAGEDILEEHATKKSGHCNK